MNQENRYAVHMDELVVVRRNDRLKPKRPTALTKGDYPGHPFRGNQWTKGRGSADGTRSYKTGKGITVIDTETPSKQSLVRMKQSGDIPDEQAQKIAEELFNVTLETSLGQVTTKVTRAYAIDYSSSKHVTQSISVTGEIVNATTGENIGFFERNIMVDGKKTTVNNETLVLDESVRGSGIGTTLVAHWEDQFAKAGVDEMTVGAVSNPPHYNGAYTWATYGYSITRPSAVALFTDFLEITRDTGEGTFYERGKKMAEKYGDKPLIEAIAEIPLLSPYLKGFDGRVSWDGYKVPQEISKTSVALMNVVNRWMRDKPAELENDDPRFIREIKRIIAAD